jgi:hypothetical protein
MARNLSDRYVCRESAIRRAEQLEAQRGKPYYVDVDDLGYYYPKIDKLRLNQIRLIQTLEKARKLNGPHH